MNCTRVLELAPLLRKKSFFLLGPRSTGKTFLIRAQLSADAFIIDLLKTDKFLRLSNRPSDLGDMIRASGRSLVVIDEVQKLTAILEEVHRLIEETPTRFLLTGSSVRKLRHGHANLLAGRAWQANLFPLVSAEIPDFDLTRYLTVGVCPRYMERPSRTRNSTPTWERTCGRKSRPRVRFVTSHVSAAF